CFPFHVPPSNVTNVPNVRFCQCLRNDRHHPQSIFHPKGRLLAYAGSSPRSRPKEISLLTSGRPPCRSHPGSTHVPGWYEAKRRHLVRLLASKDLGREVPE